MDFTEMPLPRKTHSPGVTPGLLAMTEPAQFAQWKPTKDIFVCHTAHPSFQYEPRLPSPNPSAIA